MKLVLANNQSQVFKDFHKDLQKNLYIYDYAGYRSLLFEFKINNGIKTSRFINVDTKKTSNDYSGVYINGYLNTPEIAVTVASVLDTCDIPYVNRELSSAPSLSKLSMYAKLVQNGVQVPHTFAGSAYAFGSSEGLINLNYPAVLKRADADRGIDNYKVDSYFEVKELLSQHEDTSLWILQEFIPNDGFYLVSVYNNKIAFSIFRSLEERPDGNKQKAHMYKPKGGANATLLELESLPSSLARTSIDAATAMNRQIASVDSIYDQKTDTTYVLEVNYNPQLVTIETFKEVRQKAFLDVIHNLDK